MSDWESCYDEYEILKRKIEKVADKVNQYWVPIESILEKADNGKIDKDEAIDMIIDWIKN